MGRPNVFGGDPSIGRRVGIVISHRHVFGGGRSVGGRVSRVGNRQPTCFRQRLLRRQVCQDGFHCKGISLFHIFQPFLFITLFCPPCILPTYRTNRIYIRHRYTHNTYMYVCIPNVEYEITITNSRRKLDSACHYLLLRVFRKCSWRIFPPREF